MLQQNEKSTQKLKAMFDCVAVALPRTKKIVNIFAPQRTYLLHSKMTAYKLKQDSYHVINPYSK